MEHEANGREPQGVGFMLHTHKDFVWRGGGATTITIILK